MDINDLLPNIDTDANGKIMVGGLPAGTPSISSPPLNSVPLGIHDNASRRRIIGRGNKAKIDNAIQMAIAKSQGIESMPGVETDTSTLETIFKALDFPASKVREFITGIPAEEGNSFVKYIKNRAGTPEYQSENIPSASYYKTNKLDPMSITGHTPEVIPGTNVQPHARDLFNRFGNDIQQPEWWANRTAEVGGVASDILTDPLTWLGPGLLKKLSAEGPRKLASLTTPAFTKFPAKDIPLTPLVVDKLFASASSKAGKAIASTRVGKIMGKAFIPGFGLPKEYYLSQKDSVDKLNYMIEKVYQKADKAFEHLSDEELKSVSHFVEGTFDSSTVDPESLSRITKAADDFISMRDGMTNVLVRKGLLKEANLVDNYVPHMYDGVTDTSSFRSGPQLSIKEQKPFFQGARKHETLRDAIESGSEPIEDISEITKKYGSTALTEVVKRDFLDKTLNQYGNKVSSIVQAKKLLEESGDASLGIYAPKGSFSLHSESYVPKKMLKTKESIIEIPISDLKKGLMFSKNVPVYVVPKEIARDLNRVEEVFGDEEAINGILKHFDKFTSWWKGRVTVTSPGFHLRNAYSNVANTYLAGLEDVSRFPKAIDVALGKEGRFAGKSYATILDLAKRHGVYSPTAGHWMREIFGPEVLKKATTTQLVNPMSGRNALVEGGRKVGTAFENNARLALFMDRLAKGDTPLQSSLWVKKYLFDYSELTPVERNVMKRLIPFYTWMRKNMPLQVEGLLNNPKVAAQVGKLTSNRYGEESEIDRGDMPYNLRTPLAVKLSGGDAPVYTSLDVPMSDLDNMDIKNVGFHPVAQLGMQLAKLALGEDKANRAAPELFNMIWEALPEEVTKVADLPLVEHRNMDKRVAGIDPKLYKSIQALTPLFMKVSRLLPTEGNLADPGYESRITSYLTGFPVRVVDIKKNKAMRELIKKSIIKKEFGKAFREGTVNPAAVNALRRMIKLN